MAGKVKVTSKTPKISAYKVSGATLAEIWDDIKAKGPKDGGKARAGYTTAPVTTPPSVDFDGKVEEDPKKKGEFVATVWIKSAEVKMEAEIQVPALTSDKALSPAAKKEWSRFMKELKDHENEHVAETEKEAKKFAAELQALTGTGRDADRKAAIKAAQQDFDKTLRKDHTQAKLDARLKAVNKALDSGGHGPVLDTKIA